MHWLRGNAHLWLGDLWGLSVMVKCGCLKLGFGTVSWYQAWPDWTELQKEWKKKMQCSPIACQPVPHLAWHQALSLHIQFTLLGASTGLWLTIATYGKHPGHASCMFYIHKCMNVDWLYWLNKHTHGKSPTDDYPNYAATIKISFRFLQRYQGEQDYKTSVDPKKNATCICSNVHSSQSSGTLKPTRSQAEL